MLHAGLDLSRRRLDVCLLSEHGELVAHTAAPLDGDGLRGLADRVGRYRQPPRDRARAGGQRRSHPLVVAVP